MNYRGIKVIFISPVVYLGEEFKNKHWKDNEKTFKNRIKNLNFISGIRWECPIEDLIVLSVDYEDDLDPVIKIDTLIKIFNTINVLLKVFNKDEVKMNLYLDNCDSIDMTIIEFIEWLCEELESCDSIDTTIIEFAKWVREELNRYNDEWWENFLMSNLPHNEKEEIKRNE